MAAQYGNLAALNLLIGRGVKVDLRAISEETPLVRAAYAGMVDAVKLLLAKVADVNGGASSRLGTPLMAAAATGQLPVVKLLCEKHAAILTVPLESSPMMLAAHAGHMEVVRFLIKQGAVATRPMIESVKNPEIYRLLSTIDPQTRLKRVMTELKDVSRELKVCNARPGNCPVSRGLELVKRSQELQNEAGRLMQLDQ